MKTKKMVFLIFSFFLLNNILFAGDFFTAIDGIASKLAQRTESKSVAVGIITTNDEGINSELSTLIRDQLSIYLANYGVDVVSIDLTSPDIISGFTKDPKNLTLINKLKEQLKFDIWITGTLSKWGQKNYSLQVSMYDSESLKVLGGASSIIDNNSLPAEMVRKDYDLDNTPETSAVSYVRAEYDKNAIGPFIAWIPSVPPLYGINYENKISDYFSITGSAAFLNYEEKNEWGDGNDYSIDKDDIKPNLSDSLI